MIETTNKTPEQTLLIRNCMLYAVIWTIVCLLGTLWNYLEVKDMDLDLAPKEIGAILDNDQALPPGKTPQVSPATPCQQLEIRSLHTLYRTHLFFWGTGLLIISLSFYRNKKRLIHRLASENLVREQSEKIQLFAYSVAHDLKNPVIAIHALAKILNQKHRADLDERCHQYCAQIEKSAEQVNILVDQINAFISSKEQPLTIEPLNLLEICNIVREENAHRLREKGIQWGEPRPTDTLLADKMVILRILRNLVDNALKYGGDNLTTITITCKDSAKFHIIEVTNDGNPITPEACRKIFQRYKRQCTDNKVEGTGLGLAIVRELVALHGGQVWAESDGKRGATFSFTIAKTDRSAKNSKAGYFRFGGRAKPS